MGIFNFIGSIISPVKDLVDEFYTSDEEKAEASLKIRQLEHSLTSKLLEYETKLMESKASIINSEAQGQSWLQRNWRPITMLTFLVLIVMDSFDLLAFRLAGEAWELLKLGIGGYIIGRSAEKALPVTVEKLSGVFNKNKGN